MVYKIFENGAEINTIVADAAFVESYCKKNGYTYELCELPEPEPVEPVDPAGNDVTWDAMAEAIAEGVNEV